MNLTTTQIQALEALLAFAKAAQTPRKPRKSPVRDALVALLKLSPMTRKELLVHFPAHSPHDISMALSEMRAAGIVRKAPPLHWELVPGGR